MDIFQRAVNILDRAQGRMAGATNQAARIVLTTAQIRAMESRQADLRQRLEQATMDLGRLTFQRWKNRGVGNEQSMTALCQHIDLLNSEYQQLVADLADARAAATPSPYALYPSYPPYPLPTNPAHHPAPSHTNPAYTLPPPRLAPPAAPLYDFSYPPNDTGSLPPAPAAPPKPSRECPECYTMVPGGARYCPSCGMRI